MGYQVAFKGNVISVETQDDMLMLMELLENQSTELTTLRDRAAALEAELRDITAQLYAEQSVMDDTLDMVNAPHCGDPFMPERITRVQMLGDLLIQVQTERDNWMETARQYAKNADYYQERRDNLRESIERFLALVKTEPDYATPSVILDWWKEVLTGTTNSVAQSDP